jgi:hypothetical protein
MTATGRDAGRIGLPDAAGGDEFHLRVVHATTHVHTRRRVCGSQIVEALRSDRLTSFEQERVVVVIGGTDALGSTGRYRQARRAFAPH